MTTAEKRDALRAHEDTAEVKVCGRAYPWNLGRWAKRLAEAEGIAVGEQIGALSAGGADIDALEGAVSNIILAGLLPFVDEVEDARDVVDLLSTPELFALMPMVRAALTPAGAAEGKAEPAAAG